ncbi:MAG TPA: phospholipase C, phosphocholine-specific [Caldimonas sp.]|nr:phospholipase C, phosphocholine-specific [Caldimonas sp.]HEV7577902.1 phospholipase C, phosphocholine-specific [Caldimonas sp.]
MTTQDRRKFLKIVGSGAVAGTLPPSIARALEIPAHRRTGTIADVEHVVILTQENRSFDHYFGTLRGVRGFADPRAVKLSSGKPVWYQPGASGDVLPFRPPVDNLGLTFLPDPPHGWNDTHAAWRDGFHDRFVPNKGVRAMTYHTRKDIPYHFALADAFTVCDAYHCSLMGPTDPNRYHLWTGWTGNNGLGGGPVITNAEVGYDWTSFPERLQAAGISWKVYQDVGDGLNAAGSWGWTGDPFIGNFGDNSLLYLHQYQNAQPGNPLADRAKTGTNIKALNRDPNRLFDVFREDVRTGKLPQVSWIASPEAFSEHPNFPADYGAWYISQFLDILTSNPDVWSKTVVFINYDEEGGFFDHMVPPTPAASADRGASTVDVALEIYPGDPGHPSANYGLGMRVPMLVVSPWSSGGWVNSQVFDHTSIIRFLEARFGQGRPALFESNITPWRRAVVGDLTSAFDFDRSNARVAALPATASYVPTSLVRQPDYLVVAPAVGALPPQESGVRPARALPYDLHAHATADTADGSFQIQFVNSGKAAGVFHVRTGDGSVVPRSYTVEAGKELVGVWPVKAAGKTSYDFAVHGPNGFYRGFKGSTAAVAGAALLDVRAGGDGDKEHFQVALRNLTRATLVASVIDNYTGERSRVRLTQRQSTALRLPLEETSGWYDFVISVEGDASFEYRIAGHLEDGRPSASDPAMGGVRVADRRSSAGALSPQADRQDQARR